MRKLELTFKSENGKNKTLSLNYVDGKLDTSVVMPAMQRLSAMNIFQDESGNLYKTPVAAKIVDTQNSSLFDTRVVVAPTAK
ncbi:MAG: DUF2922 domain-containing protein [Apilactobacillus sp.]|uniref:DUF2922 domain-containing protein n=1 Tax=Apilactobacillus TaxID=2767877 RepID=UPI0025E04150|nr:DUF2922 domain-containing protein [Apilactobacillus sp.]MCT6823120.1 DUF2922 domain-containing protein [Apilactobacillus sp.]MCT6857891.1 DUF2922 domain-containing protein [Apilactobacillus sp.]